PDFPDPRYPLVCEGSVKEHFMRFCSKLLFVFLLFAITAQASGAAGIVPGEGSDPAAARGPAAIVTLLSIAVTDGKVTTDGTGTFTFSSVNSGTFQVEVVAQGFEPFESAAITVADTTVDVSAKLQIGALREDVSVTATGSAIPVAQTGAAISVF